MPFSSFGDFRTALEHFGVMADRGEKGRSMYERKGLQFFLMDRDGKAAGVPVKASALYSRPKMLNLEKRFERNKPKKDGLKVAVKDKLDLVLGSRLLVSMEDFTRSLQAQQVAAVFRRSAEGKLYGVTFIDLERRVVFNGSELGNHYSAKGD